MTMKPYSLKVPCQFLKGYDEIMAIAAGMGQDQGREDDWMPGSLDVAILEILLFGWSSKDSGVIFLTSDTARDMAYYATISLQLDRHPTAIRKYGEMLLPTGWRGTLDNTLMVL